jgi:hypothetical protein
VVSKILPKRPKHLHVFGISLLVMLVTLMFFLFAVSMEAIVPGTGVVMSRGAVELRAQDSGTWEPIAEALIGSEIGGGTMLGYVRNGSASFEVQAPVSRKRWVVLETPASPGQRVVAGNALVSLAPLEDEGDRIADIYLRVEIEEKSFGDVRVGQDVRLQSNMHTYRAFGHATGKIDRLEPMGEAGNNGNRRFHAWVRVESSPFPMLIGGSVKAEVIVGQKRTYQIILEH